MRMGRGINRERAGSGFGEDEKVGGSRGFISHALNKWLYRKWVAC